MDDKKATFPLSNLCDKILKNSDGELMMYSRDELEAAAEILNIVGKYGYSIDGASLVFQLCEVVLKECTMVGSDYSF